MIHFAPTDVELQWSVTDAANFVQVLRESPWPAGKILRASGLFIVLEPGMSLLAFAGGSGSGLRACASGSLLAGVST